MNTKLHKVLYCAVILLFAGCVNKKDLENMDAGVRLVSQEEIDALKADINKIAEHNRATKCLRPVLRGKALSGTATDDMVAVVDGAQDTRTCLSLLEKNRELIHDALLYPKDYSPKGFVPRLNKTAKPQSQAPKDLLAFEQKCLPLLKRMQQAVQHEDACSPYLPGLRGQPKSIAAIRSSRLSALVARKLLDQGKFQEGFDLLLDTARFGQDYFRGGTSLLEAVIGMVIIQTTLPVLESGLNGKKPIALNLLKQLENGLTRLIASQPHPSGYMRGEFESMNMYILMPSIKNLGYSPPGGWGKGNKITNEQKTMGADESDDNALSLIAMNELKNEILSGCPPDAVPITCTEHIQSVADAYSRTTKGNMRKVNMLLHVALSPDKVKSIRREIIEILKEVATPAYQKYLAKDGQTRFQLAALRLHTVYRELAEKTGKCPDISAFDKEPLSELRKDPYSGRTIRVQKLGPGRFALWSPVPLGKDSGEDKEPAEFILCPYKPQ